MTADNQDQSHSDTPFQLAFERIGPAHPTGRQSGKFVADRNQSGRGKSGSNWRAVRWIIVLLGVAGGLLYSWYQVDPGARIRIDAVIDAVSDVGNHPAVRTLGGVVAEMRDRMDEIAASAWSSLQNSTQADILWHQRWIFGVAALLALLLLLWMIRRRARSRGNRLLQRARHSESAAGILLHKVRAACAKTISAVDNTQTPIAQWQVDSGAQASELGATAREVSGMADAIDRMSEAASQSARRAHDSAEAVKKGAAATHNAIAGMEKTRGRVEAAAEQLKRLEENIRRIGQTVRLLRDAAEQTNVLSLNASVQAAMAGEAGREFAALAEEFRWQADRSARGVGEITEWVGSIESGAKNAITAVESIVGDAVAGATLADEASRIWVEIERANRDLLETVDPAATVAANDAAAARTAGERLDKLKTAAERASASAARAVAGIEEIKAAATGLEHNISGMEAPGQ